MTSSFEDSNGISAPIEHLRFERLESLALRSAGTLDQHDAEIRALKRKINLLLGVKMSATSTATDDQLKYAVSGVFIRVQEGGRGRPPIYTWTSSFPSEPKAIPKLVASSPEVKKVISKPRVSASRIFTPALTVASLGMLGMAQELSHRTMIHPFVLLPSIIIAAAFLVVGAWSFLISRN
jgi:hypothetical protein